jgi:hypothetical protein
VLRHHSERLRRGCGEDDQTTDWSIAQEVQVRARNAKVSCWEIFPVNINNDYELLFLRPKNA